MTSPATTTSLVTTFAESERVTAVLEAADISLQNDSSIVRIKYDGSRYELFNPQTPPDLTF